MNLENIHSKLAVKKLRIMEYFGVAFDVFRVILKENKLFVVFAFLIIGARIIMSGLEYKYTIDIDYYNISGEQFEIIATLKKVFDALNFVIFIITVIFSGYFHRVIALKIENRENEMDLKDFFLKMLNLIGLIVFGEVILVILGFLGMFGAIIAMFCIVMTLCLSVGIFLYFEAYYIRDIGLLDLADYSLKLCDKNRFRKIFPTIVFEIGAIGVYYAILQIFITDVSVVSVKILISVVLVIILTFIGIYTYALNTVIFLNVEYDYFKNHKDSQFNFKNDDKIEGNPQVLNRFLSRNKDENTSKSDENK